MDTKHQNIQASAALSKIAESRLYKAHIELKPLITNHVLELNKAAIIATGIDLLDFARAITEKEIFKYESYLEDIIKSNLKTRYESSFLSDEIELVQRAKGVRIDEFKEFKFNIKGLSSIVKEVFSILNINTPTLIGILKDSFIIEHIGGNTPNYLAISQLQFKSKKLFVLFHLGKAKHMRLNNLPRNFDIKPEDWTVQASDSDHVFVSSCFLFSPESIYLMNPVNMFLGGIAKYGNNITINGITKKLFLTGYNSKLEIFQNGKIIFGHNLFMGKEEPERIAGSMQITDTPSGKAYHFVYTVKPERLKKDIAARVFL